MYHIYHIPEKKIGCTKHLDKRLRVQGADEYEILESYEDLDTASRREHELQKEYGYRVCNIPYKDTVKQSTRGTDMKRALLVLNVELTCPFCGTKGVGGIMYRWHFKKCKKKI